MSDVKTKRCTKCGEEKPLTEFHKAKNKKDGLYPQCKSCRNNYYQQNKKSILEGRKKYRERNKEVIIERKKKYYKENKKAILEDQKKYYKQNKEAILERNKKYKESNKEYSNKYRKEKYANDPEYRTSRQLRDQTRRLGDYKNMSTLELVGCSPYEFWEMNGSPSIEQLQGLHIDHVVPLSWFDLKNPDHLKVCCHYLNLQYLSSEDNLSKGDRYMGSPDNIMAYRGEFNVDGFVSEMLVIINELN